MMNPGPSSFVLSLMWFPIYPTAKDALKFMLGPPNCTRKYDPLTKTQWVVNHGLLEESANTVTWYSPRAIGDPLFFANRMLCPFFPI